MLWHTRSEDPLQIETHFHEYVATRSGRQYIADSFYSPLQLLDGPKEARPISGRSYENGNKQRMQVVLSYS